MKTPATPDGAPRVLGIVPARGGSKGIPRKNLHVLAGKPLIVHTIEAAHASRRLTRVVTTTDDEEIAAAAVSAGCDVQMRPAELAQDDTPMLAVVEHALAGLEPRAGAFDAVVLLQPTSPLRAARDIDACVELLRSTGADSVVSVVLVPDHHPSRAYRIVDDRLVAYAPEPVSRLRQDLEPVYHRNGAVYACRRATIAEQRMLIGRDARPYVMPRERSVNIDEPCDLVLAEALCAHAGAAA